MAKAACLVLVHPTDNTIAVCSRRSSTIYGLPGGKMDPGETMAETAARETGEEIGIWTEPLKLESLFADAIPGERDFWVETFVAVSPSTDIQQMESDITVKWTTWEAFLQNNAFKTYNDDVYAAYQKWDLARQSGVPFSATEPSPGF